MKKRSNDKQLQKLLLLNNFSFRASEIIEKSELLYKKGNKLLYAVSISIILAYNDARCWM